MTAPHAARIGSVGCGIGAADRRRDVAGPSSTIPVPHPGAVPRIGEPAGGGWQHRRQRRAVADGLRSVGRMTDARAVSFWLDSLPADHSLATRQQLPGDVTADVAIVGAGYTGSVDGVLPEADRPESARRGGRGRVRRLRGQRSQRWLVVGAAADELRDDGRAARSRRRGGDATNDARRRRRSCPGHREGGHRLPPGQGWLPQPGPQRRRRSSGSTSS